MTDTDRKEKLEQFRKETEGLENVVGCAYDPDTGEYVALVRKKVPEEELDDDQVVANRTTLSSEEHGVEEVGDLRAHSLTIDAAEQLDPLPAGAEEQPDGLPWVGTGSFIGRVADPTKGRWADGVSRGTVVRVSNAHVYVGEEFEPGREIRHPARGEPVGELVGAVPIEDGVTVDAAARTVSSRDGWGIDGLDDAEYGGSVVSTVSDEQYGETVTKSGRTSGVTTAEIRQLHASVNINYGTEEEPNMVRVDDCVITTELGEPGDSGAPVYLEDSGALCGLYFAGSDVAGVFSQIGNVRDELGVEPITERDRDTRPVEHEHTGDTVKAAAREALDEEALERVLALASGGNYEDEAPTALREIATDEIVALVLAGASYARRRGRDLTADDL
nr:hypothetical protein [Actinomycetota bacterium]NIU71401.1 hypothetical protein [Actinomycetota bacterium]NIW33347.1 hypothetical protein [Actinomycetota bacterium]NIX25465.1 hypothetical protein [Actinomycetota bacterium]